MKILTPQSRLYVRGLIMFIAITYFSTHAGIVFVAFSVLFLIQKRWSNNKSTNDHLFIPKALDSAVYKGCVMAFGNDNYLHNPEASPSFFIQLKSGESLNKVWGVDLKRVVRAKGLIIGDSVELVYKGAIPVLIDQRIPNTNETRKVTRYKNSWDAIKVISS